MKRPIPPVSQTPPRIVLTIAGHDPSSGAGITADLQTFAAHRLFGTSAITALTVQSTLGVAAVEAVSPTLLRHTLDHLCADLPPAGIKLGMLGSAEIANAVADFLTNVHASSHSLSCHPERTGVPGERSLLVGVESEGPAFSPAQIPIVLDPVLRSSSGAALLPPEALDVITTRLLPAVDWITPNWTEIATLSGQPVVSLKDAEAAMHLLGRRHPHLHIVATGGDQSHPTDLLRLPSGELQSFPGEHIPTTSTHGTGCAFSSALLSRLVLGETPAEAVANAKHFVTEALRWAPGLGHGRGPLHLLWPLGRP